MVCKMGWKTGETGPLLEKLRKCLLLILSLSPRLLCHPLGPSRAHLPGLREKAPCNPIYGCSSTLFYLPRAGSWAWVQLPEFWVSHRSSQDGHLRNVSLHQNCLLYSPFFSLARSGKNSLLEIMPIQTPIHIWDD